MNMPPPPPLLPPPPPPPLANVDPSSELKLKLLFAVSPSPATSASGSGGYPLGATGGIAPLGCGTPAVAIAAVVAWLIDRGGLDMAGAAGAATARGTVYDAWLVAMVVAALATATYCCVCCCCCRCCGCCACTIPEDAGAVAPGESSMAAITLMRSWKNRGDEMDDGDMSALWPVDPSDMPETAERPVAGGIGGRLAPPRWETTRNCCGCCAVPLCWPSGGDSSTSGGEEYASGMLALFRWPRARWWAAAAAAAAVSTDCRSSAPVALVLRPLPGMA
mmetsp:Transcript_48818/g.99309  ORF Transcript_48818/g.99309 Transcript_48818/m.99309 type:complete len:277 (+) Transcript_48818:35-865(+)